LIFPRPGADYVAPGKNSPKIDKKLATGVKKLSKIVKKLSTNCQKLGRGPVKNQKKKKKKNQKKKIGGS
jgi:hypothetical protein